jgi:tetratricopeptide (TPR) repeat protein
MLKLFPQNPALSEALEAEMSGNHSLAFDLLSPFWKDFNETPNTEGLSEEAAAEVFLRCGSVAGFLGRSKRIKNAQEISRKLLNEALSRYEELGIDEKIAECENHLALTFERSGLIAEARPHLQNALSKNISETHPTRLYSHIIDSLLNLAESKDQEIVDDSIYLENIFREYANFLYKGSFYNNFGLGLKNLGRTDEALEKLLTARYYFTKAEHFVYCGLLENNLARLYCSEDRFVEAHHFAQKAENTFKLVGDISRRGFSLNTRANIFLAEENYEDALDFADKALAFWKMTKTSYILSKHIKPKFPL